MLLYKSITSKILIPQSLPDNRLSVKIMSEKKGCECDPKNWRISYRKNSKSAAGCTKVTFSKPGGHVTSYTIKSSFIGRNQALTYEIPENLNSAKIRFENCGKNECSKIMTSGFLELAIRTPASKDQELGLKIS